MIRSVLCFTLILRFTCALKHALTGLYLDFMYVLIHGTALTFPVYLSHPGPKERCLGAHLQLALAAAHWLTRHESF